jgi:hypothetical protein
MGVTVIGSTVQLYANGTLLATVTDATAPTGGMQIVLPPGSEVNISQLRIKYGLGNYNTMFTTGTVTNSIPVTASHRILLKNGTYQKMPALVIRLKKQPNGLYICENVHSVGEAGDIIPATTGQQDSLEIKLWTMGNYTHANVMKVNT